MTESPDWMGLRSIIEQAGHALEIEWEHLQGVPSFDQIPADLHPFITSEDVAAEGGNTQVGAALEAVEPDGGTSPEHGHENTEGNSYG